MRISKIRRTNEEAAGPTKQNPREPLAAVHPPPLRPLRVLPQRELEQRFDSRELTERFDFWKIEPWGWAQDNLRSACWPSLLGPKRVRRWPGPRLVQRRNCPGSRRGVRKSGQWPVVRESTDQLTMTTDH